MKDKVCSRQQAAVLLLGCCLLLLFSSALAAQTVQLPQEPGPAITPDMERDASRTPLAYSGRRLKDSCILGMFCRPDSYTYCAKNAGSRKIWVAIHYKPVDPGEALGCVQQALRGSSSVRNSPGKSWMSTTNGWRGYGFWAIDPGQTKCMGQSRNRYAYYYAEDGRGNTWSGNSCFYAYAPGCSGKDVCGAQVHKANSNWGKYTRVFR